MLVRHRPPSERLVSVSKMSSDIVCIRFKDEVGFSAKVRQGLFGRRVV